MSGVRVLLADDHTIVRKGLRSLLDDEPDVRVIGEAKDGREAVAEAERLLPDIILMDITMPGLNGLEATRQVKERLPGVKVLVLTMHANDEYIFHILQSGASGYVLKQAAPAELVSAIEAVDRGDSYLSPGVARKVIDQYGRRGEVVDSYDRLTAREREVLQLIAEGNTNRGIAGMLHISVKTVETHRGNLMEKLDIRTTAELTQYAVRTGVLGLDPYRRGGLGGA
jgi:DNA-binding NarL/FixJ family response regulator